MNSCQIVSGPFDACSTQQSVKTYHLCGRQLIFLIFLILIVQYISNNEQITLGQHFFNFVFKLFSCNARFSKEEG